MSKTKQPHFRMGRILSRLHKLIYVLFRGRVVSSRRGINFLLLGTIGRKTGQTWTVPLLYIMDGSRPCVIASRGGHSRAPDWLLNIRSENKVQVQIGPVNWTGAASIVSEEERTRLWPLFVKSYRGYEGYQARTTRLFPIVAVTRDVG